MIDSYARFFSRWPISSASHKIAHKKQTNTHRQSVRWTQSQEFFKGELIVAKLFSKYPILYPLFLWVFVPKRVYVCLFSCVGQRTQKCNWINIYINLHTYIYIHLNLYVYIYVCIYIYLCIHIYLNKGADSAGTGDHPRRNRLQWYRMETARCASPGLLGAHCSLALARVILQTLGLWSWLRVSEKSGEKGPWLMVPYGPRIDEKWSRIHIYKIVMVPWVVKNGANIYLNVDTDPPIYRPGRSITVDIDGR